MSRNDEERRSRRDSLTTWVAEFFIFIKVPSTFATRATFRKQAWPRRSTGRGFPIWCCWSVESRCPGGGPIIYDDQSILFEKIKLSNCIHFFSNRFCSMEWPTHYWNVIHLFWSIIKVFLFKSIWLERFTIFLSIHLRVRGVRIYAFLHVDAKPMWKFTTLFLKSPFNNGQF